MSATILTVEDLQKFKSELFAELKQLYPSQQQPLATQWLKSYQVIKMLGISRGTLNTMNQNGTLNPTQLGGLLFYDSNEIHQLMQKNKLRPK
jgi:predicted DNA-binding transcriptional regulator AlpA